MGGLDESTNHNLGDLAPDETRIVLDPSELLRAAPGKASASLIVISGWEIGREIEMSDGVTTLGRSAAGPGVYIGAPSVSRQHARIERVEQGDDLYFTITDLQSSNGTFVNSKAIETARLEDGDRVRMGDVLFKFVLQDEVESQFHQEVHRLIHYDQLTGLLTMDAFRLRLDSLLRRSAADQPFCLAMTDLDGLKRVNDTYGHLAGRMVVREMGVMMREVVRPDDLAALYGGDEAVLLFTGSRIDEACILAEELRACIEARVFDYQGNSFGVTISQGIAEWPRHGDTPEALIAAADQALYVAKAAGRNRVVCADTGPT